MPTELISRHIFLFPFKWSFPLQKAEQQLDLTRFQARLEEYNLPGELAWKRKTYCIQDAEDYNEYVYFYDFVREILYDHGEDSPRSSIPEDTLIRHLEIPIPKMTGDRSDLKYVIGYSEEDKNGPAIPKEYVLDIDFLALNLYRNGVGVMVFHLSNYEKATADDILRINDLGRRLYPSFLSGEKQDSKTKVSPGGNLASKISIRLNKNMEWGKEGFPARASQDIYIEKYQQHPVALPDFMTTLLGGKENLHVADGLTKEERKKHQWSNELLQIYPLIDDRMFVICGYVNDEKIKAAQYFPPDEEKYARIDHHPLARLGKITGPPEQAYGYVQDSAVSDFWYRYIFVDPPGEYGKGVANELMQERLLLAHTYDRWIEKDTLYGVSRYSLVCLVSKQAPAYLLTHLASMYYKMAELLLVQRAAILRFSDKVTELSSANREGDPQLADDIRILYLRYIQFVNKIHFREVTAQEQGIELYSLMRDKMQIERDVKELDVEISELHGYATMLEENKRNRRLEWLTIIGAVLLLPTFISGFFGMNVFNDDLQPYDASDYQYITLLILAVAGLTFSSLFTLFRSNRQRSSRLVLRIVAILAGAGALVLTGYLLFYPLQRPRSTSIPPVPTVSDWESPPPAASDTTPIPHLDTLSPSPQ